jgi:hypothetical protein
MTMTGPRSGGDPVIAGLGAAVSVLAVTAALLGHHATEQLADL